MKKYRSHKEGLRVRTEACRLAAEVMAGRPDEPLAPKTWSLSVFFEMYIAGGSEATLKDFGPKEPVVLKVVGREE